MIQTYSEVQQNRRPVTFNRGCDVAELGESHVQMSKKHFLNRIPFIACECDLTGNEWIF